MQSSSLTQLGFTSQCRLQNSRPCCRCVVTNSHDTSGKDFSAGKSFPEDAPGVRSSILGAAAIAISLSAVILADPCHAALEWSPRRHHRRLVKEQWAQQDDLNSKVDKNGMHPSGARPETVEKLQLVPPTSSLLGKQRVLNVLGHQHSVI